MNQDWTKENVEHVINRLRSILRSDKATEEEKRIARISLADAEDVPYEEMCATGEMHDQIVAGTFYEREDESVREMGGKGVRFIGEKE
jgi:hypothetical protein